MEEEDIYKEDGFYIIRKEINGQMIEFGRFSNLDDAIEERDELEEYGWPYLPPEPVEEEPEEDYGQYISKKDGEFIVSRVIRGEEKVFGTFDTLEGAKDFKYRLIEHAWDPSFSRIRSKYGKFIVKEGRNFLISRNINGKLTRFGLYKTLDEALSAREKLIDDNWGVDGDIYYFDQTKYGENITFEFDYFRIKKSFNGHLIDFGKFDTLENATIARDILVENDWNISKIPDNLFSLSFFISHRPYLSVWEVSNVIDDNLISFGYFSTKEDAELAVRILIENNWKISAVPLELHAPNSYIYHRDRYFYIVRKINEILSYHGRFNNYDDAVYQRNKILLSDWNLVGETLEEEKYDDFIYLKSDGKFYVKYEVDSEIRVYGIYNDFIEANESRFEFMRKGWKVPYLYIEESKTEEIDISYEDVLDIFHSIEFIDEPEVPFPQADNFEFFIEICTTLYDEGMTKEKLRDLFEIKSRFYSYNIAAGKYLGLIRKQGNKVFLSNDGLKIFMMDKKSLYLSLVELILEHRPFYAIFKLYLENNQVPGIDDIFEILKECELYDINSDVTLRRRCGTARSWINWIVNLYS